MSAALREEDVVARLREACVAAGGQSAWAAAHGVSRERRQAKRRESQLDNSACVFSDGLCQSPGCLKDAGKSLV